MVLPGVVTEWTKFHVKEWLMQLGFGGYTKLICDIHRIDGKALLMLTEDDLKNPPLKIKILGDVKKLTFYLQRLQLQHREELCNMGLKCSQLENLSKGVCAKMKRKQLGTRTNSEEHFSSHFQQQSMVCSLDTKQNSFAEDDTDGSFINYASQVCGNTPNNGLSTHLEPEIWKTAISFSYFVAVTILTSLVMVVVHDRVPDMKKYPPLPDIFLDNVPLIPWAFDMCEVTGCILFVTWFIVLMFHKHRFILLRRFFALLGSVFLLRCVTMLITSLSVPGSHLECAPRAYGDKWRKALEIWTGFGMSVQGVRTCGDYMFSGHTVVLTMLNFFITEYTPRRIYFLHTFTWILNLFGIFFILAAREHYSIDVFIAFYITSRLFLYYHTLANSRALQQRDNHQAKIWFPLFSFFEARIDGMVPNEYQLPWVDISLSSFYNRARKMTNEIHRVVGLDKKIAPKKASRKRS